MADAIRGEEDPKLLDSRGGRRDHSADRQKKQRRVDASSSRDDGEATESSESYSDDEERYVRSSNRSWKKRFGPAKKRFIDVDYQEVFRAPPFCFQKRIARIDWRTLHAIEVDGLIQEIDIGKLETVLDTIAFGDIQGEDTRNFTEQNFIKLFRLAQLMIEYLLHVQTVLADQKSQLIAAVSGARRKGEKLRLRCLWQHDALKQSQKDLKHARKTLKTYEGLLRSNGKQAAVQQQVHHCPCCEKIFESSYYLDMHVSRRHPRPTDRSERADVRSERVSGERAPVYHPPVARSVEKSAAQVRAETEAVLQREFERQHGGVSHRDDSRSGGAQVSSLHQTLHDSGSEFDEADYQLGLPYSQSHATPRLQRRDDYEVLEDAGNRLSDLERKFEGVEHQIHHLNKENIKLRTELDAAYRELSALRSGKRQRMGDSPQVLKLELEKKEKQLIKYMKNQGKSSGIEDFTVQEHARNAKSLSDWVSDTDDRYSDLTMGITEEFRDLEPPEDARLVIKSRHSDESGRSSAASRRKQLVDVDDGTPVSDKERWVQEHQYAPIPEKPYALSKFPHGSSTVSTMHGRMAAQFEQKLNAELKKFGISANSKGISDEMLKAALSTLERQRRTRYCDAPPDDRRIMEYERSTIQWHIERAVRTRDTDRLESIFEEESEPEDVASVVSDDEISEREELEERASSRPSPSYGKPSPSYGRRTPSPRSYGRRSCSPWPPQPPKSRGGGPSSGFTEQFVSKAFSWRADDESESHTFRVTGEVVAQRVKSPGGGGDVPHRIVISPVASPVSVSRGPAPIFEDEQVEEDLGLGDWDSDDGKNTSSPSPRSPDVARQVMRDIQSRVESPSSSKATAKQKGKQAAAGSTNKSKQHASSSNASDDIKMLDELDAEINDIIR
ncbi:hypothetical protein SELMODRAFT_409244 [Selaginella moellendorffii]|uniref:C2H2-type domain-containing protein n=1 Tax=Selaginella moellendorffii TaxID=88036 RepID=D8RAU4_SELML|nr:hypothetical protein SELMODRAFT_409244 [Selaginella moellendorffii]